MPWLTKPLCTCQADKDPSSARVEIIDESVINAALRNRTLRVAALDVLVQERPSLDHLLLSNPSINISPHNAGLTEECAMRKGVTAAQNILDCIDCKLDQKLVVNAEAIGVQTVVQP